MYRRIWCVNLHILLRHRLLDLEHAILQSTEEECLPAADFHPVIRKGLAIHTFHGDHMHCPSTVNE